MTKSKVFLLENKEYEPIVSEIEKHPIGHTLKHHISVFKWFEHQFIILASNELVEAIVKKHGAVQLPDDDALRHQLYTNTDDYTVLYGDKTLAKFIDPKP